MNEHAIGQSLRLKQFSSGEGGRRISRIIIDGYNVIGLSRRIDREREDFIQLLIRYRAAVNHEITVVFDGYMQGPVSERRSVRGNVEIIFTALGETADDAIMRIISRDRREWIVVSSDRDVAAYAWSIDSVPVRSDLFLDVVFKRLSAGAKEGVMDEGGTIIPSAARHEEGINAEIPRKGNPRRQSRKERAAARALRKL